MSEPEIVETENATKNIEKSSKKRVRHRKKLLYEKILKQMEFYFSDANLSKDRFLAGLVKDDPFVPVDIFLKFNKIRALTQVVIDIVKSIKHSTILELSEDKSKVRRILPMQPYDPDTRTIYVESIPVTASREWLEQVFADYGHVAYISLPKFKNSKKIKGFAFVEFEKAEDAQKCLNTFTKMGCKLPSVMPPEELISIKTFSVDEPSIDNTDSKEDSEPPKKKSRRSKERKIQKNLELKLSQEVDSDKKLETPQEESKPLLEELSKPVVSEELHLTTDVESKDEQTSQDEENNDKHSSKRKKIKKKISKDKNKVKNNKNSIEASKGALWGLQVLSKSEWKSLRNKYLNLQRKTMKTIKANLRNKSYPYYNAESAIELETESTPTDTSTAKTVQSQSLEKIPGVFVKETLSEPCLDVRATKRTIRSNIHALHVDVKEGQTEAIVRFDSAKSAQEYCENSSGKCCILEGADEEEQWSLAEAARSSRRLRGRDRILARHTRAIAGAIATDGAASPASPAPAATPQPTHTHIRFEDD